MPTSKANDPQVPKGCMACNRPDHIEDMVACDDCGKWYHFGCANVDESVVDQSWKCQPCGLLLATAASNTAACASLNVPTGALRKTGKTAGSKVTSSRKSKKTAASKTASMTSSARAQLALELEVLNEQQQLEELELEEEKQIRARQIDQEKMIRDRELEIEAKKLAEEKAFLERKTAEELKFRRDQMAIKRKSLEEKAKLIREQSIRGSSRSSSVSESVAEVSAKVNKWLEKTEQHAGDNQEHAIEPNDPELGLKNAAFVSCFNRLGLTQREEAGVAGFGDRQTVKPIAVPRDPEHFPQNFNKAAAWQNVVDGITRGEQVGSGRGAKLPEQTCVSLGRQSFDDDNLSAFDHQVGPTNRQLAARQVMGKDLPIFSGNPEDWPIWVSNFERSTTTCGFSQDENLIRLQRCLKGPALETVRGRLLTPASVPHVIKTLQLRYGRPETLIRALTE
ncbi:PHD and RING finger domain-containing protein 1-like [Aedes albopictus]|uniref:PHD-type domain-containing protein n=1 Tax=Aedes albopictus TaxID=7160 RepID=A0ABM2A5E9_AEDAL